jgi:hypothetical protein
LGRTQVSGWLSKFRSDLTSVEGAEFWGCPPKRRTDESVKCFLTNSRITICGVSYKLGISVMIVQNILKDNLNMHDIASTFVPCT